MEDGLPVNLAVLHPRKSNRIILIEEESNSPLSFGIPLLDFLFDCFLDLYLCSSLNSD